MRVAASYVGILVMFAGLIVAHLAETGRLRSRLMLPGFSAAAVGFALFTFGAA